MKRLAILLIVFSPFSLLKAQQIVVGPYLQDATPTSIHIMWETSEGGVSEVLP